MSIARLAMRSIARSALYNSHSADRNAVAATLARARRSSASLPPAASSSASLPPAASSSALPSSPVSIVPGATAALATMHIGFAGADALASTLPVSGVPLSILAGVALANAPGVRRVFASPVLAAGLKWASTSALRAGIVCVGVKLSALEIAAFGVHGLPVVAVAVGTGLLVVPRLASAASLSPRLGKLIAAGTSICGVTAITACAPVVQATRQEISFAVANVVAFGTLGMLVYPSLAPLLFSSSEAIGMFLGVAIHDTSQVMGAALTYSNAHADELVLKIAALTKLSRNVLLALVVPLLSWQSSAAVVGSASSSMSVLGAIRKYVPLFVLGFVGAAAVRTLGDAQLGTGAMALWTLDAAQWKHATHLIANDIGAHYLLGTAMAAVGLQTRLADLRGVGVRPFVVGLGGAVSVAAAGAATIWAMRALAETK